MKLPTEAEMILSIIGQVDEEYQKDGNLGVEDIVKIVLVPLQNKLGVDVALLFEWLDLTRKVFGDIEGMDVLDKRLKDMKESVNND